MADDSQVAQLLEKLRASDRNDRWSAVQDLRMLGDVRAIQSLVELTLGDPDEDVRREAAWGVGEFIRAEKIGVMEATERLVNALNDVEPTIRGNAVLALSRMPFDENTLDCVIAPQVVILLHDVSAYVRLQAAYWMFKYGTPEAKPHLEPLLNDPDPAVRDMAARAIETI